MDFDDGSSPARGAEAAANADAVVIFVDQYMTETADAQSLNLPGRQDRLIDAVTRANPRTVVVLETGGPVLMPWLEQTAAVLEAWYPGQKGGEAIAEILSGAANPSGRLPVTFPVNEDQLPHPKIQGDPNGAPTGPVGRGGRYGAMFTAHYDEGAAVGYKWFFSHAEKPLFPFGFGLSYTRFDLSKLAVNVNGRTVTASATVRNSGERAGVATPQFYLTGPEGANILMRLVGWDQLALKPGEQRPVTISIDPRLLATFDESPRRWRIQSGAYQVTAGFDESNGLSLQTSSFSRRACRHEEILKIFSLSPIFIRSPEAIAATNLTAVTILPSPSQNSALSGVTRRTLMRGSFLSGQKALS